MPKGKLTSEYDHLLKNPDFKRWYENVARGSVVTAHVWLRRVGWINKKFGVSPETMAKMDSRKGANFMMDVVGTLEKEGKSGSYIAALIKPVKSWMEFNEISIQQKIKVRGRDELVRFGDERTPTTEELRTILITADLRGRTASAIVAFAGVRLEVLGNYLGMDGLRLGDLPEMKIKDKVEFENLPTIIKVRKELSKNSESYTTFLCEEGCEYLKEYLQWRMLRGEKLSAKSPVITPVHANLVGEFIRTINIGDLIRKAIRKAGFQWRPYVLRRYFDTRLMMAESDGLIIRDYRVYWMGHKLDVEFVYTLSKGLSKDVVEKMRQAYSKAAEKYLMTTKREGISKQDMVETFNAQFLRMAGYSDQEIAKMELSNVSPEQMQDMIRRKSMEMLGLSNNHQKIVPLLELKNYILSGWEYVRELPNNEAIVRLPGHQFA